MRVPLRWLEEFIDLPPVEPGELALALDMLGDKVERYETVQAGWQGVVVGLVEEVEDHPSADRVRVCKVTTGGKPAEIVCGAWNFEAGAKVAVAPPGALLPGGVRIERRVIRGVESNGMILSERELALGEEHSGILVLDEDLEVGSDLIAAVELPDVVFELEITTNRPDALSLLGIARDLSAHYRIPYQAPDTEFVTVEGETRVSIRIEDTTGCRRFVAREITNLTVGPAPLWMRHRLTKAGIRSISNVVDVTNYVMLELGHPLHAFDRDSIEGDRLTIRRAREGESLMTLDGERRELTPEDLVIADERGATSLAGVMGGARSEVSAQTKAVLMEAASWDPPTILYMASRHGLRSEASTRFERGVDPQLSDLANRRASALAARLSGGRVLHVHRDEQTRTFDPAVVQLPMSEVTRLLGPGFDSRAVSDILVALGMDNSVAGDVLTVTVPTYRPDVTRPADLVEEVARLHGYDKFGATVSLGVAGGLTDEQKASRRLQQALASAGLHQAVTLPFVGEADLAVFGWDPSNDGVLTVRNPLRDEERRLRPTLLPGLLRSIRYNVSHGEEEVALFETGLVFEARPDSADPRLPYQVERLGWAVVGPFGDADLEGNRRTADAETSVAIWRALVESLNLEGAELTETRTPGFHPGRSAEIRLAGTHIGRVGELSPSAARAFDLSGRVAVAELDLAVLVAPRSPRQAAAPSVFPHVDFDLSFLISEKLPAEVVLRATRAAAEGLVERAVFFDEFRSEALDPGTRAVAVRYRLRAPDRTLGSDDVQEVRLAMIRAAESAGARLRGPGAL